MPFYVGYTHKSADECQNLWRFYEAWFILGGLKLEDIDRRYATADRLRVDETEQGFLLVWEKDGNEKVIGAGVRKDSWRAARAIFHAIGGILDTYNEFKTNFAEQIAKSFADRQKSDLGGGDNEWNF